MGDEAAGAQAIAGQDGGKSHDLGGGVDPGPGFNQQAHYRCVTVGKRHVERSLVVLQCSTGVIKIRAPTRAQMNTRTITLPIHEQKHY